MSRFKALESDLSAKQARRRIEMPAIQNSRAPPIQSTHIATPAKLPAVGLSALLESVRGQMDPSMRRVITSDDVIPYLGAGALCPIPLLAYVTPLLFRA